MKYKSVAAVRTGGPEVLQVIENELRLPAAGEVRIKTQASVVCRPDLTARSGKALYSGTPLGQKPPFVPGYALVGVIDAIGPGVTTVTVGERVGALTVTGSHSEYLYWRSDRLIPVPDGLDAAEAVTLILNYIVAYQTLHRSAKVKAGERALIIGASGGIGTALLQLGRLAGLKMYALASPGKHSTLSEYGAMAIDYHAQNFADLIHQAEPDGLDVVLDGMTRMAYIRAGLPLLRRGGRWVSFGEPDGFATLLCVLGRLVVTNLLPNGKTFKLYGTSTYFIGNRRPYLEDWATLFRLLETGKIRPIITRKYPLLEAAQAHALLESGQVTGNVVLVAPELL